LAWKATRKDQEVMKKQEINPTTKIIEVEYTEQDINGVRQKGVSEDELSCVGLHKFRRSRFATKRSEQKIKVTIMLDADVLDFYKEQAAKHGNLPYQIQINRALRKAMEKAKQPQSEVVTMEILENPEFFSALANKLKKVA
jgi:uncharacterized protein (DUF4415 family)